MPQLIVSENKLDEFKSRFVYFNHHQELQSFDEINWDLIPKELHFFIDNNRPHEVLSYYNAFSLYYLGAYNGNDTDQIILDTLKKLNNSQSSSIKNKIDSNMWDRLLDRSNATYSIDLNRSKKDNITQSLLHIYASSYENTEVLFILFWICQSLIGESLTPNFNSYKDCYGNYKKGVIINTILKKLKSEPNLNDFRKVIERAYYKKLRHLSSHNAATLNDDKKVIVGIDNPEVKIKYTTAFKHFYALQQVHNYIRMFINTLLIEEKILINEGVFSGISFSSEDDKKVLALIQLLPFYDIDKENNARLNTISVQLKDDFYIFKTDKEIIRLKQDDFINEWYKSTAEKEIRILSASPDIFIADSGFFTLDSPQYGSFLIHDDYTVDTINKTPF